MINVPNKSFKQLKQVMSCLSLAIRFAILKLWFWFSLLSKSPACSLFTFLSLSYYFLNILSDLFILLPCLTSPGLPLPK